jgi:UrcA family protein
MIRFFATAAIAAMMVTGAAPAAPTDGEDTYRVTIQTGDLDLSSPAGQATFRGRVSRAADSACGVIPVAPLSQVDIVEGCRLSLTRSARAQMELARRSIDTGVAGTR